MWRLLLSVCWCISGVRQCPHLRQEVELQKFRMQLDHLPVCSCQGLDVDGMRLWRIHMQQQSKLLTIVQAKYPCERCIYLELWYVLISSTCKPVSSHHRRNLCLALHACPSHEGGSRNRGWLVAIAGRGESLPPLKFDDNILSNLLQLLLVQQ